MRTSLWNARPGTQAHRDLVAKVAQSNIIEALVVIRHLGRCPLSPTSIIELAARNLLEEHGGGYALTALAEDAVDWWVAQNGEEGVVKAIERILKAQDPGGVGHEPA